MHVCESLTQPGSVHVSDNLVGSCDYYHSNHLHYRDRGPPHGPISHPMPWSTSVCMGEPQTWELIKREERATEMHRDITTTGNSMDVWCSTQTSWSLGSIPLIKSGELRNLTQINFFLLTASRKLQREKKTNPKVKPKLCYEWSKFGVPTSLKSAP